MQKQLISAILCLLLSISLNKPIFAQTFPFTGTWQSSYGMLVLQQQNNAVFGDYINAKGTIEGNFNAKFQKLEGQFYNTQAKRSGYFEFILASNGSSFNGKWGWERNKWQGAWNGTLQSRKTTPFRYFKKQAPPSNPNPILSIEEHQLSSKNPVVIVLVHGKTAPQKNKPEQFINSENHIPYYWGFPFVKELLGGQGVYTQSSQRLYQETWSNWAANKFKLSSPLLSSQPNFSPINPPPISLFGVYRDGSISIVSQTKQILEQIESQYKRHFGKAAIKPDIVFVAHSMGGLMGRVILTNPTEAIAGERFNTTDAKRADFIRDRVRFMLTIATPHDGTRLANKGMWLGENGQKYLDNTGRILDRYNPFKNIEELEDLMTDVDLQNPLDDLLKDASQSLSDNLTDHRQKATQQATTTFWTQMNQTVLAPHKAQRTDGTLVPIYTIGGRQPDWNYFSFTQLPTISVKNMWNWAVNQGFSKLINDYRAGGEKERRAGEAMMMILGDVLHHNVGMNGTYDFFGAPPGCCGGGNPRDMVQGLDKVRRTFFTINPAPWDSKLYPWSEAKARPDEIPMFYWKNQTDEEIDFDGVVHFDSAMGLRLGKTVKSKSDAWYFSHKSTYPVGKKVYRGSWYRLLSGPWDYDNHGNLQREARNGQWIFRNLVGNPKVGAYTSAANFSDWNNPTPKPQAYAQGMNITVSPNFQSGSPIQLSATNQQFKNPNRVQIKWYYQEGARGNKQFLAKSALGQVLQQQLPCKQNLIIAAEAEDTTSGEKSARYASTACQVSEKKYLFHFERNKSGTVSSNGQVQYLQSANLNSVKVGNDAQNIETLMFWEFDLSTVDSQYKQVLDAKLIFNVKGYQSVNNLAFYIYQVNYENDITSADYRNNGGLKYLAGAGMIDLQSNTSDREVDVQVALQDALQNRSDKKIQFVVQAYKIDQDNQADYLQIATENRYGTTLMPALEMRLK